MDMCVSVWEGCATVYMCVFICIQSCACRRIPGWEYAPVRTHACGIRIETCPYPMLQGLYPTFVACPSWSLWERAGGLRQELTQPWGLQGPPGASWGGKGWGSPEQSRGPWV